MHKIHKGQAGTSDVISEIKLINRLFGVAKNQAVIWVGLWVDVEVEIICNTTLIHLHLVSTRHLFDTYEYFHYDTPFHEIFGLVA